MFLTRYADLRQVYFDAKTFSSDKKLEFGAKYGQGPLFEHHTTSLVFNDPPLHTRVRKLIAGALTQRAIAEMEQGLIALVDGLLDELASRSRRQPDTPVDLIEGFAAAIPIEIIGNLLGVPRDEREPLRDWSLAILGALEPSLSPEQYAAGNTAVVEFCDYLKTLVARRREQPGDPVHDVLTRLIQGEKNAAGEVELLSEIELLQNCVFILNAGHETTTNLIGNGLMLLQRWPDARRELLQDPALWPEALEEILRMESSNQLGNRMAVQPFEMAGHRFPAGTRLTLCIGAANRDPAQFPEPDTFDLHRANKKHLSFGAGIHQCVGLSLARLEGRIALSRFVSRFPSYRISDEVEGAKQAKRAKRVRFRGFTHLPAILEAS